LVLLVALVRVAVAINQEELVVQERRVKEILVEMALLRVVLLLAVEVVVLVPLAAIHLLELLVMVVTAHQVHILEHQ
jgi:hypothetical protein